MTSQTLTSSAIIGVQAGWRATKTGWAPNGTGMFARAINRLLDWQDGVSQRRHVAELSDHLLRDVGLTRADLARRS
jgi:uncharacterized protein YjiS (DUF1127 family)